MPAVKPPPHFNFDKGEKIMGLQVSKLMKAIFSFEQIKENATADPFLSVYDERNNLRYIITKKDFDLVLSAAKAWDISRYGCGAEN